MSRPTVFNITQKTLEIGAFRLNTQKLDMRLGLPSDTIALTLGIQNLSRNSVIQIPVRGTLQNPVVVNK